MFDRPKDNTGCLFIITALVTLVIGLAPLVFVGWVVIKLMQHFAII